MTLFPQLCEQKPINKGSSGGLGAEIGQETSLDPFSQISSIWK